MTTSMESNENMDIFSLSNINIDIVDMMEYTTKEIGCSLTEYKKKRNKNNLDQFKDSKFHKAKYNVINLMIVEDKKEVEHGYVNNSKLGVMNGMPDCEKFKEWLDSDRGKRVDRCYSEKLGRPAVVLRSDCANEYKGYYTHISITVLYLAHISENFGMLLFTLFHDHTRKQDLLRIEQQAQTIANQSRTIVEKDNTIAEKDDTIVEKNLNIIELRKHIDAIAARHSAEIQQMRDDNARESERIREENARESERIREENARESERRHAEHIDAMEEAEANRYEMKAEIRMQHNRTKSTMVRVVDGLKENVNSIKERIELAIPDVAVPPEDKDLVEGLCVYKMNDDEVYGIRGQKSYIRNRQLEDKFKNKPIIYHKYSPNSRYHFNRVKALLKEESERIEIGICEIKFNDEFTANKFVELLERVENEKNETMENVNQIVDTFEDEYSDDLQVVDDEKEDLEELQVLPPMNQVSSAILERLQVLQAPLPPYTQEQLEQYNISKLKCLCSVFWRSEEANYREKFARFSTYRASQKDGLVQHILNAFE